MPETFALVRAIGRSRVWSPQQGLWTVPQVGIRQALRDAVDDARSVTLESFAAALICHMRRRISFNIVPEHMVAMAALNTLLEANDHPPVPPDQWTWAGPELLALLSYINIDETDTWAELEQWVSARLDGRRWVADLLTRAVVVSPLTGRTQVERAAMDIECDGVARMLAQRDVQVERTHLGSYLDRDPRQISTNDSRALRRADICVFLLDGGSTGTGILIGLAHRHCAIVAVLAPPRAQLELSPLLVGMSLPHTLMRGADTAERLASFEGFLSARIGDAATRRDARRQAQDEWGSVHRTVVEAARRQGGAEVLRLPAWLSKERLNFLLEDVDSLLTASVRELTTLGRALGLPWEALGPLSLQPPTDAALTGPELKAASAARQIGRWSAFDYDRLLQAAVTARERDHNERVRAHLNLSDPEGWLDLHRRMSGS